VDSDSKHEIDFRRLRARVREKPRTKAGQVRQAWPEIKDLITAGHSLKDIWAWLNESGISIGYARLSHYIGQLRQNEKVSNGLGRGGDVAANVQPSAVVTAPLLTPSSDQNQPSEAGPNPDPLANVRVREDRRPGFNFNSQPDLRKLI
jgi:hypothetical protein